MLYLAGHHAELRHRLMGHGFKFENPNVKGAAAAARAFSSSFRAVDAMARSYFDVLGRRARRFISPGELEKRYLTLSKQFHPDRFAKAPPRERLEAVQKTTELNDAYKVLRDPVGAPSTC